MARDWCIKVGKSRQSAPNPEVRRGQSPPRRVLHHPRDDVEFPVENPMSHARSEFDHE
jgi:hypothetical protein